MPAASHRAQVLSLDCSLLWFATARTDPLQVPRAVCPFALKFLAAVFTSLFGVCSLFPLQACSCLMRHRVACSGGRQGRLASWGVRSDEQQQPGGVCTADLHSNTQEPAGV